MSTSIHKGNLGNKDPYQHLGRSLVLLDLMHRYLLPRAGRDMENILKDRKLVRVLDVACGTGYTACRLARAGFSTVGLDLSPSMLRYAASKPGNCSFLIADASQVPFTEIFDAAVISLALHETSDNVRKQIWAELERVVKPGGLLLTLDFTTPHGGSIYSRLIATAIERVEKGTLKFDPPHYFNSTQFRNNGGLRTWLEERGAAIVEERSYLGGNVGLIGITRR